ncbi:MAG TPA: hydrogenase formation protein HypD, partial [Clostridia bacterium]
MENISSLFKDKVLIEKLVRQIGTYEDKPIKLMEVCGTHTMSISKYGIRSVLPDTIKLISGPGCPVCVTPGYFIKSAVSLSRMKDVILTTFGDLVRIPFHDTSLLKEKAQGADIRIVYSPLDSLEIARENPSKKVVFLSVGFETTTPVVALTVLNAVSQGITNFMILCA